MSKLILVLSFLLCTSASAVCNSIFWKLDERDITLCYLKESSALLSASCESKACGAKELLKKSKSMSLPDTNLNHQGWSRNPGSTICKALKGNVVIAVNERDSELGLCRADDGSLIELGALAPK